VSKRFQAVVVWMNAQLLEGGRNYLIKQKHQDRCEAGFTKIRHRVNIETLGSERVERIEHE